MAKKYYRVEKDFTYRGKFREKGSRIYLKEKESEVLINQNLVK